MSLQFTYWSCSRYFVVSTRQISSIDMIMIDTTLIYSAILPILNKYLRGSDPFRIWGLGY